ncbi:DUF1254 domain-containing protein [Brucella sp. BE17]|uniref:DUF1254 domain-containing protein n=1 Tax=Brucella sp. BE17 TaxID=3142977 RepID=UPI0031BADA7F
MRFLFGSTVNIAAFKNILRLVSSIIILSAAVDYSVAQETATPKAVTVENFPRAETDTTIAAYAQKGAFGKFLHVRAPVSIDEQKIVRTNRDTLYSFGIFDLDAGPVTLSLPETEKRYMMAQVLDQDQYTRDIAYAPGERTYSRDSVHTRYMIVIVRTLVDPQSAEDIRRVHALQNSIGVSQSGKGSLELPDWDAASQGQIREALKGLGAHLGSTANMFGTPDEVDPIKYLIGAAIGWGGNPESAAIYLSGHPKDKSGADVEILTIKDVPVDGFWSISVYNKEGYFAKNALDAYSVNNLTAKKSEDGSVTVQFGGCEKTTPNCLPTMPGWNYTVRLYRPRSEILNGSWKFPEPVQISPAK